MITVYGVPGWGSTISELMLSLADIPYEVVDVEGFDQPEQFAALIAKWFSDWPV